MEKHLRVRITTTALRCSHPKQGGRLPPRGGAGETRGGNAQGLQLLQRAPRAPFCPTLPRAPWFVLPRSRKYRCTFSHTVIVVWGKEMCQLLMSKTQRESIWVTDRLSPRGHLALQAGKFAMLSVGGFPRNNPEQQGHSPDCHAHGHAATSPPRSARTPPAQGRPSSRRVASPADSRAHRHTTKRQVLGVFAGAMSELRER